MSLIDYMEWALDLPRCEAVLGTLADGRVLRCELKRVHYGGHSVTWTECPPPPPALAPAAGREGEG